MGLSRVFLDWRSIAIFTAVTLLSACGGGGGGDSAATAAAPTPPLAVVSTTPANGATGVALDATITVVASRNLNPASIAAGGTFTLTAVGGGVVTGDITVAGATATFAPLTLLAPNTQYAAVISTNATDSTGSPLPAVFMFSFTTVGIPGAPTIGGATAGDQSASVSFSPPADTGGATITGFTATSFPSGITATGATSPIVFPFGSLATGVPYTFTVTATNIVGTGPPSAPSNDVTPSPGASPPGAPTFGAPALASVPGNGQVTVNFNAPASSGTPSSPLTYTVTARIGGVPTAITASGGGTSIVVPGLTNGTAYTFTVVAFNPSGPGPSSAPSAPLTPVGLPGAPTALVATANALPVGASGPVGAATVTFTAPASNGGSAITGYTVTSSPGGGVDTNAGTPGLSHVITGLVVGTPYTFTVTATNSVGTGAPSAPSNSVTPTPGTSVPNAPAAPVAVRGNAQATVTFTPLLTAPANGGSPVTSYTVTSNPSGISASGSGSPIVVPGLINGTPYTFTVRATNIVGEGPASPASNSVTPATVPGVPTGPSAVAGSAQATVSFTPPASNGGSAITGFTVTSNPSAITATGAASPIVVPGLSDGTAYTFTVSASNAVGTGAPSVPTASVTPSTVTAPGAPTAPSAVAGNAQATVSFTPPASDGGSLITGFTVTSSPSGITATGGASPIVVTGLTNGTPYVFTVTATNIAGTSPPSAVSNAVVPATVPGAPGTPTATAGSLQATVAFAAPASNGGAAITSFTVTSSPDNVTAFGGASPIVVTGLNNTTSYTFTVAATNSVGTGPSSAASNSVSPTAAATAPGAPSGVTATVLGNSTQATVSFVAPASDGGSAITSYTVTSSPPGGTDISVGLGLTHTVTGLTPGVAYTFRVTALNGVGTSPPSGASNSVTPVLAPGAPTAVSATAGIAQATVSFTPPASNGGSAITTFTVNCVPACPVVPTGAASPILITGLSNIPYTFRVSATNAGVAPAGPPLTGPLSAASNTVTPDPVATVPAAPTGASATAGNAQATVSFVAGANGGSPITGFTVTSNPAGGVDANAGTLTIPRNITGLSNGTAYTFTVTAINAIGPSPASGASNSVTPAAAPAQPAAPVAVAGNTQATVSFVPPTNNGSAILDYVVQVCSPGCSPATTSPALVTASPFVVTGLTNGVTHTFRVAARNAVGTGAASPDSNAVVPTSATVPGAPTGASATAGNAQATVTFTAGSTGGSPITGFAVTSNPSGGIDANAGTLTVPRIITGLTNGVAYTFTVTAANAVGTSAASLPSVAVTPAGAPGAPTAVNASAGNLSATVSFTPPASNGGSAITSFTVTSSPDNVTATGAASPIVVGGLTNGTPYTFTVTATNSIATGLPSAPSNSVIPTASGTACSPTTPVVSGAISLRAQAARVAGVAPLGVFFDATATTSSATTMPFHEIEYRWNFDDAGSGVWAFGSRAGVSSRNLATGPVASHLFETPGTRNVTVTAFDGTNTATCNIQVIVSDPEPQFSGSTLCVDTGAIPVAGFDGCPVGAAVANNNNFTAVINTVAGNGSTFKRILFRRGKTYTSIGAAAITSSGPGHVGAYGATGGRPVITGTGSKFVLGNSTNHAFGDWRIVDLDLDGITRAPTSTGFGPGGTSRQITIWNNIIRNLQLGINLNLTVLDGINVSSQLAPIWSEWLIGNNQFTTDLEYGFLGPLNRSALLGNQVFGQFNQHAARLSHAQKVVVSNNELTGTASGTALTIRGAGFELANRTIGNQFTLPANTHSEETVVSDNKLIGGASPTSQVLTYTSPNATEGPRFRNHIAERNWIITSATVAIFSEASLTTIRNNLIDLDLSPGAFRAIVVTRSAQAANPNTDNVFVYNNSAYTDSAASAPLVIVDIADQVTPTLVIRNNLAYAPNNPPTHGGTAPVRDIAGVPEVASNNSTTVQIRTVNPLFNTYKPTQPSHWQPSVGSYAINGGFAAPPVPVFSDFFGAARAGNHMGAVNP